MSKKLLRKIKQRAYWFILLQILLVLMTALAFGFSSSLKAMYSVFLGGLVSILPTVYFTRKLFSKTLAQNAKKIVRNFYIGEFIKLALMGILFILFINLHLVLILPFVVGFFAAQMTALLAPIIYSVDE